MQTSRREVVVSFVGGWGHVEPLLPLARLASSTGWHVTFAGQHAVVPRLAALGFATAVVGPDTLGTERLPLQPVDRELERAVMRDHFVGRYGRERALSLGELFDRLRPGVVVCDEVDVGAVVAAERRGIPCVTVGVIAAGRLVAPAVVGEAWESLRVSQGLSPDPDGDALAGTVAVVPVPRSFRDPALPWGPRRHAVRPPILDDVERSGPGSARHGSRPFVYATLGTVFNVESGDLLDRLVAALGRIDADALVTVGPGLGPDELTPAPNVRVESFVPQREVLGRCDAVVCHGGSGTLVAALSLGVPVVVLPMGADQPDNADRCVDLGVGVALDPIDAGVDLIADAIAEVVGSHSYIHAAQQLAGEAARQPPLDEVDDVVGLLEG